MVEALRPGMAVDESEIMKTAEGLVARHGRNAVAIAKDRANALSKQRNLPELDTAFRVLSAVERLVGIEESKGT
jgi:hypothetical protein